VLDHRRASTLPQAARRATRVGRGRQLWESKEFHKIEPLA
jgi:hypothetical protein